MNIIYIIQQNGLEDKCFKVMENQNWVRERTGIGERKLFISWWFIMFENE